MAQRESTSDLVRDVRRLTRKFINNRQQQSTSRGPELDLADLRRELMLHVHPDRPDGDTRLAQRINRLWDLLNERGVR